MSIEGLQQAILDKNADAVVAAIAPWDEARRQAAIEPFNILMLALGFHDAVIKPCTLSDDDPQVKEVRQQNGFQPEKRISPKFDHQMLLVAQLACVGLVGLEGCQFFYRNYRYESQVAQLLADRRPVWLDQWYQAVVEKMAITLWVNLYEKGVSSERHFPAIASRFIAELPKTMETAREATHKVLREIPSSFEGIYDVPQDAYQLFHGSTWVPVISWLSEQRMLDASRMWQSILSALHAPHDQTKRNACVMMAKAIKSDANLLDEVQPQLLGLVADSQASVVGFAVEQLEMLQEAGRLNGAEAIAALPAVFAHKPKTHAIMAIGMLARLAADESLRSAAVEAVAAALIHPNKDVQKAALAMLEQWMRPVDSSAAETISRNCASIAATLKSRAEGLLRLESVSAATSNSGAATKPAEKRSNKTAAQAQDDAESARTAPPMTFEINLDTYERALAGISETIRERLRIGPALAAARAASIDHTCRWNIQEMRILASAEPVAPIESVEELVDVTAAAVEACDNPDTVDRILSGIARHYRERPKSFTALTASLAKRACGPDHKRPQRGIVGGHLGRCFSLLIGEWLKVEPERDDYFSLVSPLEEYVTVIQGRISAGTCYPLLSEATHRGGWIDARTWVERLQRAQQENLDYLEADLVRSLLRLAPDEREQALSNATSLQMPLKAIATAALGGDVKIDASLSPQVWIAALRARDAWIDLTRQLPPEQRKAISPELEALPDVVYPADYQWQTKARADKSSWTGDGSLIEAWPTQHARQQQQSEGDAIARLLQQENKGDDEMEEALMKIVSSHNSARNDGGYLTADLHRLLCGVAPAYAYPYLATQWPMKLDWYWSLATICLSRRVESGSSVEEPYGRFLLPLLEPDRPLTLMAARALWIATVSKDDTSRSMAVEIWIELAGSDRADVEILLQAVRDVESGGWVKVNRFSEVLADVAKVSPHHAWVVASVLEGYLVSCESLPRDVPKLLEPLDECCEQLGRAVSPMLAARLQGIKSGKAAPLARSLLQRTATFPEARMDAVTAALNARIARAQRTDGNRQKAGN